MLLKCCSQYASKFGKLSSGHRTGKGVFIPIPKFQRKAIKTMFKVLHNCTHLTRQQSNVQNFPTKASKVCELITSRCSSWIQKRQRNQTSNCQHPLDHRKSMSSRKTSNSALLTTPMPLIVWITTNYGKFLKRWEYQTT